MDHYSHIFLAKTPNTYLLKSTSGPIWNRAHILMVFPYPLTTQSSPQWSAVPFNDAAPSFGMTIANHLGKTTKNLGQIIVNVNLLEEYLS